jgi:hypothetical protein
MLSLLPLPASGISFLHAPPNAIPRLVVLCRASDLPLAVASTGSAECVCRAYMNSWHAAGGRPGGAVMLVHGVQST